MKHKGFLLEETDKGEYMVVGLSFSFSKLRFAIKKADLTIPAECKRKPIAKICRRAFERAFITGVNIPDSVKRIEEEAFINCSALNKLNIGKGVSSIQIRAFTGCESLARFDVALANPYYKTVDGNLYTRDGKTLVRYAPGKTETSFTVPDGVERIEAYAFEGCDKLSGITLPDSITQVGVGAFEGCTALTYTEKDGLAFLGNEANPYVCLTRVSPASAITVNINYKTIQLGVFKECKGLKSLTLGDNVTLINSEAFKDCHDLSEITLPIGVTSVGASAFEGCKSLTRVNYFGTVDSWVQINFANAEANPLRYSGTLYANGTPVTAADIHVAKINDYAFCGSSGLTELNISDGTTYVGNGAFYNCNGLKNITVGASNASYKSVDGVLYTKDGQTLIRYPAGKADTTFTFPSTVTAVCEQAFSGCRNLTEMVIPNSVKVIGGGALSGCASLESITLPFVGEKADKTVKNDYQYPFGFIFGTDEYEGSIPATQTYHGASTVKTTTTTYYLPSALKTVTVTGGDLFFGAFSGCSNLAKITIPDGIDCIREATFDGCGSLTGIAIPSTVKKICKHAFFGCSSISELTIPSTVTEIEAEALNNCPSLTRLTIPFVGGKAGVTSGDVHTYPFGHIFGTSPYTGGEVAKQFHMEGLKPTSPKYVIPSKLRSVTVMGGEVFMYSFTNCKSLTSVTLGNNVTALGSSVFQDCTSLNKVNIPEGITKIDNLTFFCCESLTSVTLPNSLKKIGKDSFYSCKSLKMLTIPTSVTKISGGAFYNCKSLTSICYYGTKEAWLAIEKDDEWCSGTTNPTVICTNGRLDKKGNPVA